MGKNKNTYEDDEEEEVEEEVEGEEEEEERRSTKDKKKNKQAKKDRKDKKDKKQKKKHTDDDDDEQMKEESEEEKEEEEENKIKSKKKKSTTTSKSQTRDISLLNNPYRNKNFDGKRFDEFIINEHKKQITIPDDDSTTTTTTHSKRSTTNISSSQISHVAAPTTMIDYEKMYLIFQSMENDFKEIASFVTKRLNERKQAFEYVQVVMQSITAEDEKIVSSKLRGELIEKFLQEFIEYQHTFEEKDLNKCMDLMLSECDGLTRHAYREISHIIVDRLSTNRKSPTLLLLPKVMEQLSFISTVQSDIDANESFKVSIFKAITESEWNPMCVISIISTLNDMTFTKKEQMEPLIAKILGDAFKAYSNKTTHNECIDQLPHLIHNVILLSRQGNKGKILSSVCDFFAQLEGKDEFDGEASLNPLAYVESMILQQIRLSIQQDPDLGKEYFKLNQRPSQFVIGLLMVVSKIPRFKTTAFETLKQLANNLARSPGSDGLHVFMKTVENNWEQITDPFVNFSIMLMESNALVVTEQIKYQRTQGQEILLEIYVKNMFIRGKIIDEIVSRIIMKSDSLFSNWYSLLGNITALGDDIKTVLPKLKEIFNYLPHYSTGTVTQLIQAFRPILLADNGSFLNGIILILKKSMFAREVESRSCAVTGFIELLKAVSLDFSGRRLSHNHREVEKIKSLYNEVFGILRRALSQQNTIRTILYQGFIELINYEDFSDYVYELLNAQTSTYFELTGNEDCPLLLGLCIEYKELKAIIVEPIDKLIYCVQYCLINGKGSSNWEKNKNNRNKTTSRTQGQTQGRSQSNINNNNNNNNNNDDTMVTTIEKSKIREILSKNFQKMISLMNECNLSSFGLPNTADGKDTTNVKCLLMIGVVESLIEHQTLSVDPKLKRILLLFEIFSQLKKLQGENQLLIQKSKSSRKKKSSDDDAGDDDDQSDNDDAGDDDGGKSKRKSKGGKVASSKTSKSTTSSSIIASSSTKLSIEFPSKECFTTLLQLIYKSEKGLDREEIRPFLIYIYQVLSNLLTKLVSTFKMYRKNVDMRTIESKKTIEIGFFKTILPYVFSEIKTQEWVPPPPKQTGGSSGSKKSENSIHSTAIQCFNLIFTFIQENGSETLMYSTLQELCDELIYNEDIEQFKIQNRLYKQQSEKQQRQKDNQEDEEEEEEEEDEMSSQIIQKPVRPTLGQNVVRGRKIIQRVAKSIEMIVIVHLFPEYYPDIEMLLNSLVILYNYLNGFDEIGLSFKFLRNVSSSHPIESPSIASIILKAIVEMCRTQDSPITGTLSTYVLSLLGSYNPSHAGDSNGNGRKDGAGNPLSTKVLAIINAKTVASTINILLENEETNIERNTNQIKDFKKDWKSRSSSDQKDQSHLFSFRDAIAKSFNNSCQVFNHLSISKITGPPRTKFLDTIRKLFSHLTKFIEMLTSTNCKVNDKVEDLIEQSSLLCSNIVDFVAWIDNDAKKNYADNVGAGKQMSKPEKVRLIKETKILPEIIGNVEKYQSYITKYEKKLNISKQLGKHFKQFKSREFTIESTVLQRENTDEEDDGKKKKRSPAVKKSTTTTTTSKKPAAASKKRKSKNDDDEDDEDDYDDSPTKKSKRSVNISKPTGIRKSAAKGKK